MTVMAISIVLTLGAGGLAGPGRAAHRQPRGAAPTRLHYLGDLLPNIGAIVSLWASARFGLDSDRQRRGAGGRRHLAVGCRCASARAPSTR